MKLLKNTHIQRGVMAVLAGIFVSSGVARATVINVANPNNFLVGATVKVAAPGHTGGPNGNPPNQYTFTGDPQTIVDNLAAGEDQDGDFLFENNANNRFSVSGFGTHSGAVDLRFFIAPEDGQRVPTAVAVYSSTTNQTSTNVSDYTLVTSNPFTGPYTPYDPSEPTGSGRGYFSLPVTLPAGTQSLLVAFTANSAGTRIYEFQAVPEPASCALLTLGAGIAVTRRRRQIR